ncbi:MAG TPA: DnaA N-terminal domain-containing protein [Ktedonobacteraceae bacterium]|jgi:hypothetical protein
MDSGENLFARKDQARMQERIKFATRWEFRDLDVFGQIEVKEMAEQLIRDHAITDEAEMQETYREIKRQYLEYRKEKEDKREQKREEQQTQRGSVREQAYTKLDKASPETGRWMRSSHAQELWKKVLKRLEEDISSTAFRTWFKDTEGTSYQDDVLIVCVSTLFARTQLETRFIEQIRSIISEIDKAAPDVRFESPGTSESSNEDNDTSTSLIENNGTPSSTIEDITQDPEYIRGYQRCIEYEKKEEERRKSPYLQGWRAAYEEVIRGRASAIETELEQQEQQDISLLRDLLEGDAIKQIKEEMKQLDERLRKLEKYTEE